MEILQRLANDAATKSAPPLAATQQAIASRTDEGCEKRGEEPRPRLLLVVDEDWW